MKTKIIAAVLMMISIPISGELTPEPILESNFPDQIGCNIDAITLETEEVVIDGAKLVDADGYAEVHIKKRVTSITVPSQSITFNVYDVCVDPEGISGELDEKAKEISDKVDEKAKEIRQQITATGEYVIDLITKVEQPTPPTITVDCDPSKIAQHKQNPTAEEILNDGCRELNGIAGNCQKNGDCPCGSMDNEYSYLTDRYLPTKANEESGVVAKDTDRDGVPDDEDPDDDCDFLSDNLEQNRGMNPLAFDDYFDMNPGGDVEVWISIKKICDISNSDFWNNDDPYLNIWVNTIIASKDRQKDNGEAVSFEPDRSFSIDVPNLNIEEHPINKNCVTFDSLQHGVTKIYQEFSDERYKLNRGSGADFPEIEVEIQLMDDDDAGTGEDNQIGKGSILMNLFQTAWQAGGAVDDVSLRNGFENDLGGGTISGFVDVKANSCAIYWGSLIASGYHLVQEQDLSCDS